MIENPKDKYVVAEVLFRDVRKQKVAMLLGAPRVAMLCKFYRGLDLGDYEPYVMGAGVITRDEVAWEPGRPSGLSAGKLCEGHQHAAHRVS